MATHERRATAADMEALAALNRAEQALLRAHGLFTDIKARKSTAKRKRDESASSASNAASDGAATADASGGAAPTASSSSSSSSSAPTSMLSRIMHAAKSSGTATTGHVMAGALARGRQVLEETNDPLLFSHELVSSGWDPAGGKDLVVNVPEGYNARTGNTMTARCTVRSIPGVKRTYSAVHMLGPGQDVSRACLAHVALWHYTDKTQGSDQFYTVGFREGEWRTRRVLYKTGDALPGPVKFDKPFWLRFVLAAGCMLLYLDGRFVTAFPLHPAHVPADGSAIRVMLAVSGDYGERCAMSVSKMWWGASQPDERARSIITKIRSKAAQAVADGAAAAATVQQPPSDAQQPHATGPTSSSSSSSAAAAAAAAAVAAMAGGASQYRRSSTRLYVGNWPQTASLDDMRHHFAAYEPVDVLRPSGKPFGFVTCKTPELASRAIQEIPQLPLHGSPLQVQLARG